MAVKKRGATGKRVSSPRSRQPQVPPADAESVSTEELNGALSDGTLEEQIRRRAYELYEARGRTDGFDQEDWSRAKAEVLSRHRA
jgi:Protein of unknown function (DUF2934)